MLLKITLQTWRITSNPASCRHLSCVFYLCSHCPFTSRPTWVGWLTTTTAPRSRFHPITLFACWFQPAQTSQATVFFSHNKSAPASPETNQRTGRMLLQRKTSSLLSLSRLNNERNLSGKTRPCQFLQNSPVPNLPHLALCFLISWEHPGLV